MDGGDSATSSPKRNRTRPAVRVDGQRHRLVRRSAMPRSITSPILATPSSATSSLAHSSMNTAFAPATAGPTASYHSSFSISPAPTTAAGNGKKKKQGFFDSLKPKERPESSGSQDSVVVSSPLPPLTSPKASKLLGLKVGVGDTQSGQGAQGRDKDKDKDEGLLNATDELTDFGGEELPEAAEKQTRFKEEGLEENDSPNGVGGSAVRLKKLTWKEGNKKAMRMLDLLPSRNTRSKGSPNSDSQDISPLSSHSEADAEAGYSSDSNIHPHLHAKSRRYTGQLSSAAQPIALQKLSQKGRARKKGPKVLHKMTPITEASSIGEDGAVLSEDEGATTLAFINDYEGLEEPSDSTLSLPRSLTESALSRARYQLSAEDGLEDEQENKQEQDIEGHVAIIQSKFPGLQNENYYRLGKVQIRGPLQQVEHDLLDELEEQMRMNIDDHYKLIKTNKEKRMMDARTAELSKKHDKMKEEFEKITGRKMALGRPVPAIRDNFPYQPVRQHLISKMQDYEVSEAGVSDEDEEDDLGYDSDDEATVHGVERVNFVNLTGALKVRPGVVKMIDIPPRKQKDIGRPTTKNIADEVKSIYSFKQYGQVGPISQKSGNVTSHSSHGILEDFHDRFAKYTKPSIPRDESRLMIQDWVSNYNNTEQRPLSERIDLDVLRDQAIAPAPLPKDYTPSPSRQKPTIKHFCVNHGHIFDPIDLKLVPDEVSINELAVRPYLETEHGVREHVKVSVTCHRCQCDMDERLYECQIPVCGMTVCYDCAVDLQTSSETKAITENQKKTTIEQVHRAPIVFSSLRSH